MKNYYLVALCSMFLLSSCGDSAVKKEKKTDREEMRLKGKVQFLVESNDQGSIRYTFNEAGNLLSECYSPNEMDAEEVLKTEYSYGTDGKLMSISHYKLGDGALDTKEIYNSSGNMTALEKYNSAYEGDKRIDKLYSTTFYEFDDKGLQIKSYMNADNDKSYSEYECDGAGNVLKRTDYFNGSISRVLRFSYKYDNRGNITEYCVYDPEMAGKKSPSLGKVIEMKQFKFDDTDSMLEQIQSTYEHDGENHFLRQERFFNYKLDEHHNPVEISSSQCTYPYPREEDGKKGSSNGIPVKLEYEYDAKGNWTSKKSEQNGRTAYTSRSISYFE